MSQSRFYDWEHERLPAATVSLDGQDVGLVFCAITGRNGLVERPVVTSQGTYRIDLETGNIAREILRGHVEVNANV